jgi:hypothetical protein
MNRKILIGLCILALTTIPAHAAGYRPAYSTSGLDANGLPSLERVVSTAGDADKCTCNGSGRVATCTCEEGTCQCNYDWQGYPSCSCG